jgi:hypothetical protein
MIEPRRPGFEILVVSGHRSVLTAATRIEVHSAIISAKKPFMALAKSARHSYFYGGDVPLEVYFRMCYVLLAFSSVRPVGAVYSRGHGVNAALPLLLFLFFARSLVSTIVV